MNFEYIKPINIKKAYIIHFKYKSTEEFINKLKRGYSDWFKDNLKKFLIENVRDYLKNNNASPEKIKLFESELNLNLSDLIKGIRKNQINKPIFQKFLGIFH